MKGRWKVVLRIGGVVERIARVGVLGIMIGMLGVGKMGGIIGLLI